MTEIVLATLNAKYLHASFGLRYLLANLGDLASRACLMEFDINQRPLDIAEVILHVNPRIIGLGVYIWNRDLTLELIELLKKVNPQLVIILGGPEVVEGWQPCLDRGLVDYIIKGEAELQFRELCDDILEKREIKQKILQPGLPDLSKIIFPYHAYSQEDIKHRLIYVEASRGCPYGCEFCLSSLDEGIRYFPLDRFLAEMQTLLDRGVLHFKFVDRTFNVDVIAAGRILKFFLDRMRDGLFLHFEIVPERLPEDFKTLLKQFPMGTLQLEMGIQTFNPEVARRINRSGNHASAEANIRFLRSETQAHIHADLIVGLPGESYDSFAAGFDRLWDLKPHEIQVGILKKLPGTPLAAHDEPWQMIYRERAPYDLLQNGLLPFPIMQRMRRYARYWDLLMNSGNYIESGNLMLQGEKSAFKAFMQFSDWLFARIGRQHGIAQDRLASLFFEYLIGPKAIDKPAAASSLWSDYKRIGRRDPPESLRPWIAKEDVPSRKSSSASLNKRQARHVG